MARLDQHIVLVNEYTLKNAMGPGGSRGGTPGSYVTRYMARHGASEPIAPIRRDRLDQFVTRYMARDTAVDKALKLSDTANDPRYFDTSISSTVHDDGGMYKRGSKKKTLAQRRADRRARRAKEKEQAKADAARYAELAGEKDIEQSVAFQRQQRGFALQSDMEKVSGYGGVAFSQDDISLSHEQVIEDANTIQRLFEQGHTVNKTVLSFDQEYLERNGIIPPGLDIKAPGDYRGHVDQLKLRASIQQGLRRMAATGWDDMRYVGVIQVDTENVHCHLAIVDAGYGRRAVDGTQRGKLNDHERSILRRGMDNWLDRHKTMAHLSSAVDYEKRSVVSYVKRWAYESIARESVGQFIVACLPQDQRLWRAQSNAEEMAKPNRLVRELVEERISLPGSPMWQAMVDVNEYADERVKREGLTVSEREQLVDTGRERIITASMNGVYNVLAAIPDVDKTVHTPLLTSMSWDYELLLDYTAHKNSEDSTQGSTSRDQVEDSGQPTMEEFALRLRSYTSRLHHHERLRDEYEEKMRVWREAYGDDEASDSSRVMYEFYSVENDYHRRAIAKYRHFLDFVPPSEDFQSQWDDIQRQGDTIVALKALRGDRSLPKMADADEAEALGKEIYGVSGGGLLVATGGQGQVERQILDDRIERMTADYESRVEDIRRQWVDVSARLEVAHDSGDGVNNDDATTPSVVNLSDGRYVDNTDEATIYTPGAPVQVRLAPEFDFADVRGVDLHDMGYDWLRDQHVGSQVMGEYNRLYQARYDAVVNAQAWLEATDQGEFVDSELGAVRREVEAMGKVADEVGSTSLLASKLRQRVRELAIRRQRQRELDEISSEAVDNQDGYQEVSAGRDADPAWYRPLSFKLDQMVAARMNSAMDASATREVRGMVD